MSEGRTNASRFSRLEGFGSRIETQKKRGDKKSARKQIAEEFEVDGRFADLRHHSGPNLLRADVDDNAADMDFEHLLNMPPSSSDDAELTDEQIPELVTSKSEESSSEFCLQSETKRLAVTGLLWEKIDAEDILALCRSVADSVMKPGENYSRIEDTKAPDTNDLISRVDIYKSDYGRNNEDNDMPPEIAADATEDQRIHRMRQWEARRALFFFAIISCESPEVASAIIENAGGVDCEIALAPLEFRYVPDDMIDFKGSPTDSALHVSKNYEAPDKMDSYFNHTGTAGGHGEDSKRDKLVMKLFTEAQIERMDFERVAACLSESSSEEEEDVSVNKPKLSIPDFAKQKEESSAFSSDADEEKEKVRLMIESNRDKARVKDEVMLLTSSSDEEVATKEKKKMTQKEWDRRKVKGYYQNKASKAAEKRAEKKRIALVLETLEARQAGEKSAAPSIRAVIEEGAKDPRFDKLFFDHGFAPDMSCAQKDEEAREVATVAREIKRNRKTKYL